MHCAEGSTSREHRSLRDADILTVIIGLIDNKGDFGAVMLVNKSFNTAAMCHYYVKLDIFLAKVDTFVKRPRSLKEFKESLLKLSSLRMVMTDYAISMLSLEYAEPDTLWTLLWWWYKDKSCCLMMNECDEDHVWRIIDAMYERGDTYFSLHNMLGTGLVTLDMVKKNPGKEWPATIVMKYVKCIGEPLPWPVDWKWLSANIHITTGDIMKYVDKWNWQVLSHNKYVPFDFIIDHPELPWQWLYVSARSDITIPIYVKHINMPWDMHTLSRHIRLTSKEYFRYPNIKWSKYALALNDSITWCIKTSSMSSL